MSVSLYINCSIIALLGLILAVLLQMKSQNEKARQANLIFSPVIFLKAEWITISISIVVIIIGLYFIPIVVDIKPQYLPYIKPAFLPLGYMGTDIILKLFGVMSKRLNAAIEVKSQESDKQTGTLDAPTPAAKIVKP
jgi:putative exporter of polyketide antibiotics